MLLSIFGHPKSTEHPHKLPDRIFKELPENFHLGKTAYFKGPGACVKNFLNLFKLAVRPGLFESAYSTVRPIVVNNYFSVCSSASNSPSTGPKAALEEGRIIRRTLPASIGSEMFF